MRIITNNFQKNQFFFTDCGWRGGGGEFGGFWGRSTSWFLGGTEVGGRVSLRQQGINRVRLELTSY